MKILVVEDSFSINEYLCSVLKEEYSVESVFKGIEAVESAIANPPDLIICNIALPGIDGRQVLKKLQENKITEAIPFIFTSTCGDAREGMNLGADDFLTLPCSSLVLTKVVRVRLKRHQICLKLIQEAKEKVRVDILRQLPDNLKVPLTSMMALNQFLFEDLYPGRSIDDLRGLRMDGLLEERGTYLLDLFDACIQMHSILLATFRSMGQRKKT